MSEEAQHIERQAAYIDTIRSLHKRSRNLGFVACLAGVLIIVAARYVPGAPTWLLWAGLAVIGAGWGLFAWSILRRVAWVRAHPFDGEA